MELIITSVIGGLLTILAVVMLTGRGSFMIAGFNTMSKEGKAKYDAKALSKFLGAILLPIGLLVPFTALESTIRWYPWVFMAMVVAVCVFAVIYVNKSDRFKK